MVVTWVTMSSTDVSIVEYGQTSLNLYANGSQDAFIDGGSEKRKLYVHRVKLTGLKPGNPYGMIISFLILIFIISNGNLDISYAY